MCKIFIKIKPATTITTGQPNLNLDAVALQSSCGRDTYPPLSGTLNGG